MKKFFEKVRESRKVLENTDSEKVSFVLEAYGAYTEEAAQMNDELEFTGNPEATKLDFLIVAVTENVMTEEEFEEIWAAVNILSLASTPC